MCSYLALVGMSICIKLNLGKQAVKALHQHTITGSHRPASETSLNTFAGGPIVVGRRLLGSL